LRLWDQVVSALEALHPYVRREVRRALDDLNVGKSRDGARLTGELAGFWRLRIGKHRMVFRYVEAGQLAAKYLGPRSTACRTFRPPKSKKAQETKQQPSFFLGRGGVTPVAFTIKLITSGPVIFPKTGGI
jgi:mRNA interferase RelE/StbE